jgi:hypothetical protein
MGDHPAVGEDPGGIAEPVDEGLVEAVFADDGIDTLHELRPALGEPRPAGDRRSRPLRL